MKHKLFLFLFLFLACTLLAGRALAQGCSTSPIGFPAPGASDKTVAPGTCIANADPDSPNGQGGRFRWDNNNSHELQLFDADDNGQLLWCANPDNTNGGSSGDTSNCFTTNGSILCLQQDGNMVIYAPSGSIQPHCVNSGDGGTAIWASGTDGANDGQEELAVEENPFFNGHTRTGDRAVIRKDGNHIIWVTLGFVD